MLVADFTVDPAPCSRSVARVLSVKQDALKQLLVGRILDQRWRL